MQKIGKIFTARNFVTVNQKVYDKKNVDELIKEYEQLLQDYSDLNWKYQISQIFNNLSFYGSIVFLILNSHFKWLKWM